MNESTISPEADALYQPLGGLEPWAAVAVDDLPRPGRADDDDPSWTDMVARGVLLACAHESGALDGVHGGDGALAVALLRGVATVADVAAGARPHVVANFEALRLAQVATDGDLADEAWIRRVHEVACHPQLTHPVHGESGVQDHVLATGEYKHHPNHERTASGGWVAHAPVDRIESEMGRYLDAAASEDLARLHPAARAAYAHHAITHVAPFADGNGRVARALATAHLGRAAGVPFLVLADQSAGYHEAMAAAVAGDPADMVELVAGRAAAVVDLLAAARPGAGASPEQAAALDRWRRRTDAGAALHALLPPAVDRALDRHRRRPDLGHRPPLTEATVGPTLVITDRPTGVEEALIVDAHPLLDDAALVLRAQEAQLRLVVSPDELSPAAAAALAARLDPWLDRVVSVLALRMAAELE